MGFSAKYSRFAVLSVLLVFCSGLAAVQNNAPVPPGRGGDNAGESGLLRGALVESPQAGARDAELMRLLAAPAVQKTLGLTDEQRTKIDDIVFNLERTIVQQEATLRLQKLDLNRLIRTDEPDRPAIDKKLQEITQTQATVTKTRVNSLLDALRVLTKEQREKLGTFVQRRAQPRVQPRTLPGPPIPLAPPAPPVPPVPPTPPEN